MSQTLSDTSSRLGLSYRRALLVSLGIVAAAGFFAPSAFAFTNPTDYGRYPNSDPNSLGGGAGRYFTGSPADGYSCEVCHSSPSNYSFPLTQKGLPLDGYVPREPYKIELSSPAATAAYRMAENQGLDPVTTLVAEFIAEDGGPAGTISFATAVDTSPTAFPSLYCSTLAMADPSKPETIADSYGMNIYAQETSSLAMEMTVATPEKGTSCTVERGEDADGKEYERRCIVALKPCGAQSVKFTWTAPDEWRGPIWFSAGFVTTYDRTAAPNDNDFVTTLSIPLNPGYQGSQHENVLESGCSVAHGPRSRTHTTRGVMLMLLSVVGLLIRRSRQRRASWSIVAGIATLVGCSEGSGLMTNVGGAVGAYESARCSRNCEEPIVCRETAWPDAGTPEEAAEARAKNEQTALAPAGAAGAGAAGSAAAPSVKSLGIVTAQFVTAQPPGFVSDWVRKCEVTPCDPHYVTAWIEQADADDNRFYVRTLLGQKGGYVPFSLVNYTRLGYDCQVRQEFVFLDALTTASIFSHQQHVVTWDGTFGSGHKAAPAGLYHLRIEVAIDETHHFEVADIPFMFGDAAPATNTVSPAPAHTGVTLTYTPTP